MLAGMNVPRKIGLHIGHRLFVPLPLLCRHLRHAHHPWPGPGHGHGAQMRRPGTLGVGCYRRRRCLVDRHESSDPLHSPQCGHRIFAVQQPDIRAHQGAISPTSEFGKRTKSSPLGTIEQPIHPVQIALAAEATFVSPGRSVSPIGPSGPDDRRRRPPSRARRSSKSCRIAWCSTTALYSSSATGPSATKIASCWSTAGRFVRGRRTQRHRAPRHGTADRRGGRKRRARGRNRWYTTRKNRRALASLLASLQPPEFPSFGVFRQVASHLRGNVDGAKDASAGATHGRGDLPRLLNAGTTWLVE